MKTATLMQVTDRWTHRELSAEMYFNPTENAKKNFAAFDMTARISMEEVEGVDDLYLCEELFDLTNNPYRQHERPKVPYSMSVGDVVVVGDDEGARIYVCCRDGWEQI